VVCPPDAWTIGPEDSAAEEKKEMVTDRSIEPARLETTKKKTDALIVETEHKTTSAPEKRVPIPAG